MEGGLVRVLLEEGLGTEEEACNGLSAPGGTYRYAPDVLNSFEGVSFVKFLNDCSLLRISSISLSIESIELIELVSERMEGEW